MPARIVPAVVREHAELAAFQWAQRDTLSQEDPPDPAVIAGIDRRLRANLDGLRIAGAAAWPFIIDQFEDYPEKGELFVATVQAIVLEDVKRTEQAVAFAGSARDGPRGLCGAFQWLPPHLTRTLVRRWLLDGNPVKSEAAISALEAHMINPGRFLPRLLAHPDMRVRAAASRLAVALGIEQLPPATSNSCDAGLRMDE